MTKPDHKSTVSEAAIGRLVNPDRSSESQARAEKLGRLLLHHIILANQDPSKHSPTGDDGNNDIADSQDYKISNHVIAWLSFVVSDQFAHLENTPNWLLHASCIDLSLELHDIQLPDDISNAPDGVNKVVVTIAPIDESTKITDEPVPCVAHYEDGEPLDAQNTETVIGVLALLANKIEAAGSRLAH